MNIETATRLYEYRKAHGYSQEELAAKIGVSRQAISKWERSESSPDTDNLIALAQLYGVSLDTLLMGEEEPAKKPETDNVSEDNDGNNDNVNNETESEVAENETENTADDAQEETPDNENPTQQDQPQNNFAYNSNTENAQNYSNTPANVTYYAPPYSPASKKKLSKGAKIGIIAAVIAALIIIAAVIGIEAYSEIREERLENAMENSTVSSTTTMPNGNSAQGNTQSSNSANAASINRISVEWGSGNINVAYYDGTEIQYDDGLDANDECALVSRIENGELKIYFQRTGTASIKEQKDLQINIPNGMTLNEFDIECRSGNITVNGITASALELHNASGDINATGAFTSIDVETNSGNAQVTNTSEIINKIDANTTSGNITITVPQNLSGFYMEYETRSGSISNDFGAQTSGSSRNGRATYGNSSTQIEVETVSGNFSLKAAK